MIDYVEELIEHQKIFMEVVSEVRSSNMFTFPVLTYSLLYRDGKFVDEEFARWCSDHNTTWNDSNFFISGDVNTLSNCCFDAKQEVRVKAPEEITPYTMTFGDAVTKYGTGKRLEVFVGDKYAYGKLVKLPARAMYKIITFDGRELIVTDNHIHPTGRGDLKTYELRNTDCLKTANDYVKIASIQRLVNYHPEYVYCFEMEDHDNPYFVLENGIMTHNCRLLSDTSKLNAFINSIGGTALSIGSVKVNTINLMRIAHETKNLNNSKDIYLKKLKDTTILCCKTLDTVRTIISRNVEKGLLPNYVEGGVELDKQYCTIGILGLYEVIREFGLTRTDEFGNIYYTQEGIDFASEIFNTLNEVKDNFKCNYSFNIESVPAERAAVVLCQKDNELFELRDNPEFIYSNQWIPLSAKCTIQEKLRICSILDEKCSGGSIAHINLESNFPNTDMAWDMLNKIAQSGVIYFAFNTRINECINHHGFVGTDICPVCGQPAHDTYQRIVGYLVPTRAYSKDRFKEFNSRRWFDYAQELKVMME